MIDLLKQALILTGWGMGMTFLAIGALVVGMYFLTMVIKDKEDTDVDNVVEYNSPEDVGELVIGLPLDDTQRHLETPDIENIGITPNNDDQNRALAASVAVAIALSQESEDKEEETFTAIITQDAWNHYVRGRHLSQRSRYEQLKHR